MKDYGRHSTFASFLPGIAGIKGIPIWCYYVNRGQGVVSFGVDNKDHAIMEFYPAHVAYQNVKRTGFRTFIKKNGEFFEAFSDESLGQDMDIEMNTLRIHEENKASGLSTEVMYYILPEEPVGALVRRVTITNNSEQSAELEILDGMPAVIPYGVGIDSVKNMTQTAKAWMQVEDTETNAGYYRVRASMDDTAAVSEIEGGNFAVAYDEKGNKITLVGDPDNVFDYDTSLTIPVVFKEGGIKAVCERKACKSNLFPCAFFAKHTILAPGESTVIYELIGQVEKKYIFNEFLTQAMDKEFFENKLERAVELVEELCQGISTTTGNETFDRYCKYTYMDNVLRGGFPIKLGNNKIFYVYSRKHGDLERDYNYFAMTPEFFSQGNGNFRDVNQNRRCDTFFAPFVGRENIHTFYSLMQLDGYNPLGVEKLTYQLSKDKADMLLSDISVTGRAKIESVVTNAYTPGQLYQVLSEFLPLRETEKLFGSIIDFSDSLVNGNFGEGYWSDHWTYNLDLVEEYLSIFPEKEQEMLYEKAYTFFLSQANINPRFRRYAVTDNGVRQYYALDESSKRSTKDKLVRADYGKGDIIYTTLMEKLILLCTLKFATLDAYGMGVEMEGGKPGWYDALNGMPGMLGSSMAETYELARMLDYTIGALKRYDTKVELLADLAELLDAIAEINDKALSDMDYWNQINDAKEDYRRRTYEGISGSTTAVESNRLAELLAGFLARVEKGVDRALEFGNGICPTYFTFTVSDYEVTEKGIEPKSIEADMVPFFLEGPVRYLKLDNAIEDKRELYANVKNSDLYDNKLSMYKVNASLENASFELGRARAFTPGWLENESIWLHMEYKYLLELLKSGMYDEFGSDFYKACIPFLDEKTYGRSVLENSSFIASSKNPNEKIHGKGFVARLSGSTIEFISMWKLMMFGKNPFCEVDGELTCQFAPAIPEYLIGSDLSVAAKFMGQTDVNYHFSAKKNCYPGQYTIEEIELEYEGRRKAIVTGSVINGALAHDVRDGKVKGINIKIRN